MTPVCGRLLAVEASFQTPHISTSKTLKRTARAWRLPLMTSHDELSEAVQVMCTAPWLRSTQPRRSCWNVLRCETGAKKRPWGLTRSDSREPTADSRPFSGMPARSYRFPSEVMAMTRLVMDRTVRNESEKMKQRPWKHLEREYPMKMAHTTMNGTDAF
jgi:hypothetical protein